MRGADPAETDPTAINGLIRRFLDTFEKSSYVAYTATPFANIFISPDQDHRVAGEDLFPRSFIVNLPAPSNYIGPERVFGLRLDGVAEVVEPLPIVRTVDDYQQWLPDRHNKQTQLGESLPSSLVDAILSFLVAGAVRRLRGQGGKHHSMLIHVTRFTNVQSQVANQVEAALEDYRDRLRFGEGNNPTLRNRIAKIYSDDHSPTTLQMSEGDDLDDQVGPLLRFAELWSELARVAEKTRVHTVNGTSEDVLEYVDQEEGLSVIAIGGDKLSRGLTLEGLSVSYFLRASKMYDTLMQMGRWFGYRRGYLDLCRLYTTPSLVGWYAAITAASAELQEEFEAMAAIGRTPEEYGLRVRQHPDGLLVTAPSKLRHSTSVKISYSSSKAETTSFLWKAAERNWSALERMVTTLDTQAAPTGDSGLKVWKDVPPQVVLDFLSSYTADSTAVQWQPKGLIDYIGSRLGDGELVKWTVGLADVETGDFKTRSLPTRTIGLTRRASLGPLLPRDTRSDE